MWKGLETLAAARALKSSQRYCNFSIHCNDPESSCLIFSAFLPVLKAFYFFRSCSSHWPMLTISTCSLHFSSTTPYRARRIFQLLTDQLIDIYFNKLIKIQRVNLFQPPIIIICCQKSLLAHFSVISMQGYGCRWN